MSAQSPEPYNSREYIPNNMVWAILTTLFCCLPFGIVSIVYAAQVDGKPDQRLARIDVRADIHRG